MPTQIVRNGSELLVNSETTGDQLAPAIAVLANGGYVVTWHTTDATQDGSSEAIKAQIYDAAGDPQGSEFLVNTAVTSLQRDPVVTGLSDGGFVVSWATYDTTQDGDDIATKAQVFDAAGVKQGSEFLVNTAAFDNQLSADVTGLSGGGFVVTWYTDHPNQDGSGTAIKAQVFDAAGAKQGAEFLVNTSSSGNQGEPATTSLSNGGFVVTWVGFGDGDQTAVKAQVFNAAGVKQGGEFLVNTAAADYQSDPQITGLTGGGFVVTWTTSDGAQDGSGSAIKAQIFNADGTKLGTEFLINAEATGDQDQPSITGLSGGGFIVTWTNADGAQDGNGSAIKAQVFDATGTKQNLEILVNSDVAVDQNAPDITALPNGVAVTWRTTDTAQDGSGSAIKTQVFDINQVAVSDLTSSASDVSETEINGTVFATLGVTEFNPVAHTYSIVNDPSGAFQIIGDKLVVAENRLLDHETVDQVTLTIRVTNNVGISRDQDLILAVTDVVNEQRFDAKDEFLVNTQTASDQLEPKVTELSGGGFVVTWTTEDPTQDGHIFAVKAQVFDASGAAQGPEFLVNTEAASIQFVPDITSLSNGGFVVTWQSQVSSQDNSGTAIKAQVFDASGAKQGSEFLVNTAVTTHQLDPAVTDLSGGGFVVTWFTGDFAQDGNRHAIKAQVFDASGAKLGSEFLVNTASTGSQLYPDVTGLSGGGFVVAWETWDAAQDNDGRAIKAQVFDASGVKQGAEFLVNTAATGSQATPVVTDLSGGGFVVSWRTDDATQDGDGFAIKAQVFDSDGTKVGSEFLVNTAGEGYQEQPDITGLSNGGFIATWTTRDSTQDGSGNGVKAQIFDAAGVKQGNEFLVNFETTGSQSEPEIVGLSDGSFAVTWTTHDPIQDGSGLAIKARVFDFVTDTAPAAADGTAQVAEDGNLASSVVANASDADGDTLIYSLETGVSNGSLTFNTDGSYTYTPSANFEGSDSFTYKVTDVTGKTDTGVLTLTVTGQDDASVVTGSTTGTTAEEGAQTASGVLAVTDIDAGDNPSFIAQTGTAGTYGSFVLTAAGVWTYSLNAGAQALVTGQSVTETFIAVATTTQGVNTNQPVIITVTGSEDAPSITGATSGTVVEDADETATGTLVASDVDAADSPSFTVQAATAGSYGSFALTATGAWTYTLNTAAAQTLNAGASVTETFTAVATTADGETISQVVTITASGAEDGPVITGSTAGTATEDSTQTVSGVLTASDPDSTDTPGFTAQTGTAGTYGSFALTAAGAWTYTLDNAAAQSLAAGQTVTETFTAVATTADGETVSQVVTLSVTGTNDAPVLTLSNATIDENSAGGTAVGNLLITDPDTNDTHSLRLLNDAGGLFVLNGTTLQLSATALIDYELQTSHVIKVEITESTGATVEKEFTINVQDLADGGLVIIGNEGDNVLTGGEDSETVRPGLGDDTVTLGGGADTVVGTALEIFSDTFTDFGTEDRIIFTGTNLPPGAVTFDTATGIASVDTDGDGTPDGTFTLGGEYTGGTFMVVKDGANSIITFETFLPTLGDQQAIDLSLINGINNQAFLTGDGETGFRITLNKELAGAANDNTLGVYEIDGLGDIIDVRLLANSVKSIPEGSIDITGVEAGHQLGFFIVQDGANWANGLGAGDTFSFIDISDGGGATIQDGSNTRLAVNGEASDRTVFHSFDATLNADGLEHVLSGVNPDGQSITVGFEDLSNRGDSDYQDVVFSIDTFEFV